MNGLINPIKHLFRRKDDPVTSPTNKDPNEPLTIPSEYSNHVPSPFYQDENDDDYFVYKLEPDDNKWSNWEAQSKKNACAPAYFGLQVSDTIKNSNIHVFPDRQDLVNPSVGRAMKYGDNLRAQNCFGGEYYQKDFGKNGYQESRGLNSPSQDERDQNLDKILPTSLLEESQQKEEQVQFDGKSKAQKHNRGPRQSSDYQAYSRVIPQGLDLSTIESKKNIDDFSAIIEPKKAQKQNLDESDDMNFALVIKTLENNITKAKAFKHHNSSKIIKNSKPSLKFHLGAGKKQDDTLSLDQSSGLEHNYYMQEPQDLMSRVLKKDTDSNHTIFYSFATTDKHTSGIAHAENPYANHPNPFGPGGHLYDRPNTQYTGRPGGNNLLYNFPTLTRIEEETFSAAKTLGKQESPSGTGEFGFLSHRGSNEGFPLSRNRASEPVIQGFDSKRIRTRNQSSQFGVQYNEKGHVRTGSQGGMFKDRVPSVMPKSQPSENYVLCINCNDLLPSNLVDLHSKYCNESMIAPEELAAEIVLETKNPQVTLERCNMRLKKIKMLLEKNLKNFKGQVQLGIVDVDESDNAFSIMELIIKIAEEVIRNDKVLSKLTRDIVTIENFKEDLAPFIDVVLASIMMNNVGLFTQTAKQKEKALDLVQKKDKEQYLFQSTFDMREDSRNSLGSKFDFEKLRLLTTPNKVSGKPSSYSYKPSTDNYVQSTGGSSLASQRLENRMQMGGDTRDWIEATTRNSHKKEYY